MAETETNLDLRFTHSGSLGDWLGDAVRADMDHARLSKLFRAFYRVRPFLPIFVRQLLQRVRSGRQTLPSDWYFPAKLISQLELLDESLPSIWPNHSDHALVLTHDVESADGMKMIPAVAKIEEELGFRSAWFLVPYAYKIDHGLVRELRNRGHEIGVHGFNHDGRLFQSRSVFEKRLKPINQAIRDFQATGFRTPMVHRNLSWMQGLEIDYDASTFDVDPLQAMPGGVQNVWPFMCGKFVELPYTLPQDHTLFVTLGESTDRIWRQKLDWIRSVRGMALMLTHPDYLNTPEKQQVYRSFLGHLRESGGYTAFLPHEIASWTRGRLRTQRCISSHASVSSDAARVNRCEEKPESI